MIGKKPLIALMAGLFLLSLACSGITGTSRDSDSEDSGKTSGEPTQRPAEGEGPSEPEEEGKPTDGEPEDSGPSGPGTVKVGEVFKNGWFRIVVLGWTDVEPTDMTKPDAGNKIIAVDLTAVNLGKDIHQLYEYNFSVKDSESREYEKSAYLDITSSGYETRNIFPGDRWTGSFGFQVPEDSSGYTLVMKEDSSYNFDRVLVEMDTGPGLIEPPASIEGEQTPDIHPAGEAAPCGDLTVQAEATQHARLGDFYLDMMPPGFEILLAELMIKNTGSSDQALDQSGLFWLQVSSGRRYGESFLAESVGRDEVEGSFFGYDDAIAAGETLRGWKGFGVPEDLAGPWIVFWCGLLESRESMDKVEIALP
jgi:hypothetical protein